MYLRNPFGRLIVPVFAGTVVAAIVPIVHILILKDGWPPLGDPLRGLLDGIIGMGAIYGAEIINRARIYALDVSLPPNQVSG